MKTGRHIRKLSELGNVYNGLFEYIAHLNLQGMTTGDLDRKIGRFLERIQIASFLSRETSFHSHISSGRILCHGIPSDSAIIAPDATVHVDIPLIIDDLICDASWTFLSDKNNKDLKNLLDFSWKLSTSLIRFIREGMSTLKLAEFCMKEIVYSPYYLFNEGMGHGTGYELHEEPYISYSARTDRNETFREGMVFTVEPVVLLKNSVSWTQNNRGEILFSGANSISCYEFTAAIINGKCQQISFDENNFKKSIDSPSYF